MRIHVIHCNRKVTVKKGREKDSGERTNCHDKRVKSDKVPELVRRDFAATSPTRLLRGLPKR